MEDFTAYLTPTGVDRFAAAGMAATWWEESFFELQTAVSRGWKAVLEAWLTTAEASQEDKKAPPLADHIAIRILAAPELAKRSELVADHARLDSEIKADGNGLSPAEIRKLKSARTKAKKNLKAIDASLLDTALQTLDTMPPGDAPAQAIGVLRSRIEKLVADHFATIERSALGWYDNLVGKYGFTLRQLETQRDAAAEHLNQHFEELGYGRN